MDLVAFSYDRSFVLDALRQGEIDYLEHVSDAAEADLFRHLSLIHISKIIRVILRGFGTLDAGWACQQMLFQGGQLGLVFHHAEVVTFQVVIGDMVNELHWLLD